MPSYDQPDPAATRETARLGLPAPAVAVATHAGAVVNGTILMRRDTLAQVVLIVYDAGRGYPRQVRAQAVVRPGDEPGAVAAALLGAVGEVFPAALERVKWGEAAKPAGAAQDAGKSPSIDR
jgi:hypothetical protein